MSNFSNLNPSKNDNYQNNNNPFGLTSNNHFENNYHQNDNLLPNSYQCNQSNLICKFAGVEEEVTVDKDKDKGISETNNRSNTHVTRPNITDKRYNGATNICKEEEKTSVDDYRSTYNIQSSRRPTNSYRTFNDLPRSETLFTSNTDNDYMLQPEDVGYLAYSPEYQNIFLKRTTLCYNLFAPDIIRSLALDMKQVAGVYEEYERHHIIGSPRSFANLHPIGPYTVYGSCLFVVSYSQKKRKHFEWWCRINRIGYKRCNYRGDYRYIRH